MNTKRHAVRLALTAAIGLALALPGSRVRAQEPPPLIATGQFGLMGAVSGEFVRLNVSNINLIPPPCHAIIQFVGFDGAVLALPDGTPLSREVTLDPGQSGFVQFNASLLLPRGSKRVPFRPVVLVAPPEGGLPVDPCVPSLEFIDGVTGQTRLVVPGATRTYAGNHSETLVEDR